MEHPDPLDTLLALLRARYPDEEIDAEALAAIQAYLDAPVTSRTMMRCPPGSLCEACLDAPATLLRPAPWGGDMGICIPCAVVTEAGTHGGE